MSFSLDLDQVNNGLLREDLLKPVMKGIRQAIANYPRQASEDHEYQPVTEPGFGVAVRTVDVFFS